MTIVSEPRPVALVPMQTSVNLRQIVSRLANSFLPLAVRRKSFFINDIPEDLYVNNNQQLVASVLGGLIASVVAHAKDSCIRVSAKVYSNIILVHVKDCNNGSHYCFENGIKHLQPLAERMGGVVSITSQRFNVTTFAFSFPNSSIAA